MGVFSCRVLPRFSQLQGLAWLSKRAEVSTAIPGTTNMTPLLFLMEQLMRAHT